MLSSTSLPCRNLSSPRNWRRAMTEGEQVYPQFCFDRHLSQDCRPGDDYRQGYDPSWRHHCGRNGSSAEPIPPALLPVRHSPSRRRHRRRWWSLTPPFHPSPAGCCRVATTSWQDSSLLQLSSGSPLPELPVSSSDLALSGLGVGRFLWGRRPSDGSLARPLSIQLLRCLGPLHMPQGALVGTQLHCTIFEDESQG